jgi:hypothetical protein
VDVDNDVAHRNVIAPFHDVRLVRAGVAYVDDNSHFCFADVTSSDPSTGARSFSDASELDGFRVEGIKAVKFELGADKHTLVVSVIAEGDSTVTGGENTPVRQAIRNKWPDVDLKNEIYYEEFSIRWRTRNIDTSI